MLEIPCNDSIFYFSLTELESGNFLLKDLESYPQLSRALKICLQELHEMANCDYERLIKSRSPKAILNNVKSPTASKHIKNIEIHENSNQISGRDSSNIPQSHCIPLPASKIKKRFPHETITPINLDSFSSSINMDTVIQMDSSGFKIISDGNLSSRRVTDRSKVSSSLRNYGSLKKS